jgi:Cu/Ag efflux protein CusF
MVTGKQIRDFATVWVAISATVGLSLWVIGPVLPTTSMILEPAPSATVPEPTPDNSGKAQTGRIIELDLKGTIVLEHHANGEADAPIVVGPFNVQDGLTVSDLKTGDDVVFTAAEVRGVWTVTKIQKQ